MKEHALDTAPQTGILSILDLSVLKSNIVVSLLGQFIRVWVTEGHPVSARVSTSPSQMAVKHTEELCFYIMENISILKHSLHSNSRR